MTDAVSMCICTDPPPPWTDPPLPLVRLLPRLRKVGRLRNEDVRKILRTNRITAGRALKELIAAEWLTGTGRRGAGAYYLPGRRLLNQSPIASETRETDSMTPETGAIEGEE